MKYEHSRSLSPLRRVVVALAAVAAVAACTATQGSRDELVATTSAAVWTNGSFETGAAGAPPASWTVQPYLNPNPGGVTIQTPQTRAGLNLATGGNALTTTVSGTNTPDPDLGAGASLRYCRYGTQCARVNFHSSTPFGNGNNVNSLTQTMTVAAGDVDPADGLIHVRFAVAPVLENPVHAVNQQPYYFIQLTNITQNTILYTDFNLSAQPGVPWKTVNGGLPNEIDYTDWSLVDISSGTAKLAIGDSVKLEVIAGGCSLGGHFGEIYVDGVGSTVPGIFISGTGPAQANAGTNITYTLTYKNGAASAETGVVIDFTTSPNTTFQAITPPAGATCVTPAVGAAGTIVCTFSGPVAASASGTLTITVGINAAATGTIVAGTYDIHSTQETALTGNKIVTEIGCLKDTDCSAGHWCKETAPSACTPTLANGVAVPNDPSHTNPIVNGTCTAAAGAIVCTSAVCDTKDSKCGYANGDGPCTVATGATVCRSGACSTNGTCEPAGGCNVDADCTAAQWCAEATHTCTAKLANGTAVPTDPPHTNPTLNGTCTAAAGTLVCVSAVCDTKDNLCGFANGDGPCTLVNGATVCRSQTCSANGKCMAVGTCNVDADCTAAQWCSEGTHTCMPRIANGGAVPSDPPHTNPTLNGTCTAAAGTLVCVSAVCDAKDNLCGYANGDGPCTVATGAIVCRSGTCSSNGTCVSAGTCNADADCAAAHWCDESTHACMPKIANGGAVPSDPPHTNPTLNGTCTAAAGTLVCVSAVCDTKDNECGYANGDGPCTAANGGTVCRSGNCSGNGTCAPAGSCNVDSDCATGHWCDESTHTCAPQIANGGAVPTDPPHSNPTLNGTCTAAAGTLVCVSGVCDTKDNECGYANGDGPCTASNGGTVCRSGVCSSAGTCESPDAGTDGGSPVDAGVEAGAETGVDAAVEAGADAPTGTGPDASAADATAEPDASDSGVLEGGGCTVGPASRPAPPSAAGVLLGLGLALRFRRRRRP